MASGRSGYRAPNSMHFVPDAPDFPFGVVGRASRLPAGQACVALAAGRATYRELPEDKLPPAPLTFGSRPPRHDQVAVQTSKGPENRAFCANGATLVPSVAIRWEKMAKLSITQQ